MLGTDAVQSITDWLKSLLPKLGTWLFGQVTKVAGLFGVVVGLALIPIYAFYFLLEKEGIVARWRITCRLKTRTSKTSWCSC